MAKWHGSIGFIKPVEKNPGVWVDEITVKHYYGDLIRNNPRWQNGESINDDLNVNNQISVIANSFAYDNFCWMKYVEFMGVKWKITSADVQRPRIILTIGGVYNG